jgi:hypothetical protein
VDAFGFVSLKVIRNCDNKVDILYTWLGIVNLFQTFDDFEPVKYKPFDTRVVHQLLTGTTAKLTCHDVVLEP